MAALLRQYRAFSNRVIAESSRYQPDLISIASSATDESSLRLLSPVSCMRGPRIIEGAWEEKAFLHVGAFLAEFEFQRYRPRSVLTDLLNSLGNGIRKILLIMELGYTTFANPGALSFLERAVENVYVGARNF